MNTFIKKEDKVIAITFLSVIIAMAIVILSFSLLPKSREPLIVWHTEIDLDVGYGTILYDEDSLNELEFRDFSEIQITFDENIHRFKYNIITNTNKGVESNE